MYLRRGQGLHLCAGQARHLVGTEAEIDLCGAKRCNLVCLQRVDLLRRQRGNLCRAQAKDDLRRGQGLYLCR